RRRPACRAGGYRRRTARVRASGDRLPCVADVRRRLAPGRRLWNGRAAAWPSPVSRRSRCPSEQIDMPDVYRLLPAYPNTTCIASLCGKGAPFDVTPIFVMGAHGLIGYSGADGIRSRAEASAWTPAPNSTCCFVAD